MLDLRGVFEALPGLLLLLAPDGPHYTILAASEAYARAIEANRAQLVGRGLFEARASPDGAESAELRAALDTVVRHRTIERTPPRRLRRDDRWWRTINAPVLGEDGQLRCIVHQAEDVTEFVRREKAELAARQAELRLAFQLRLGDALRELPSPIEVQTTACRMLGEHLAVNRVHFAEIEGDEFVIRASYVKGARPFAPRGPVETFGAGLLESYRRGQAVAMDDVERDPRLNGAERARLRAAGTAAFAGATLSREGRWVASLGVHSVTPRVWTPDDLATISQVADRIWTGAQRAQAESGLRESEARYAAIFEKSPIGKALTRWSDGVIVNANPAFLRIFGFTADEVLGRTSIELGISNPAAQAQVRVLLEAGGSVRDFECRRTARAGGTRILSLNLDWVSIGGEKHILTTVRDLTELRTAEETARAEERERVVAQARAEALRRSEAKVSGILQTSADAIVSIDEQQRITVFNRAAEEVFGYSRAEALGAPIDLLIPDRLRAEHRQSLARFAACDPGIRTTPERIGRLVGLRKGGEEFPADAAISKVTIEGKTVLTISVRDVTARLRAETELRLLSEIGSALASRIAESVALTQLTELTVREFADFSTFFLVGEDGSVQRHGVACRDPARESLKDLIMGLPVDQRRDHPFWKVLATRRSVLFQIDPAQLSSYAMSDEHRRVLEAMSPRSVMGVPLLVGQDVLGALFVAACRPSRAFDDRDVALVEEIARRVALSLENARLYHAAQKAVGVRDEVLGIVAHDLRSPLGTTLIQTGLIRAVPGLPERPRRAVEAIDRSVLHMKRMINDLLDVTSMESGHLELDRAAVAPGELLAEVVETHRDSATADGIELRVEAPPELPEAWADRGRLLQVFENLLGNALRVTGGGRISMGAGQRAGELLFWVADTGPGIAPEDLPHVFDRFWQARKARRGGAGLGLSIVKLIVEAHGGRIWFESRLHAGTTAFFTLPARAAAVAAPPPAAPA